MAPASFSLAALGVFTLVASWQCASAINYHHGGFLLQADASGLFYSIAIDNNKEWFVSAPSRAHCSAVWYSTNPNGTTDTPMRLANSSVNE